MSIENDEITKLKVALEESKTRERIAIKELQKMRQRAEKAEKSIIHKACEWLQGTLYIHTEIEEDRDFVK